MNEPVQLIPMLAMYEDDGEFTLRLSDSPLTKQIYPTLIKAIGERSGVRKLTLITPTDTKVFRFNGGANAIPAQNTASASEASQPSPSPAQPQTPRPVIQQDSSAPPAPELADEHMKAFDEAQEAERIQAQIDRDNKQPIDFPQPTEEGEPAAPKTRKRTPRPQSIPTACGRCGGAGVIAGGGACPVCQGKGAIAHYGSRR